jgi:predicted dehydrogenase
MTDASRLGVAIIGLGTVGRRFIEQFIKHDGFTLIGGFDVGEAARAGAANDFGIAIFESADELVDNPGVDLVYIATPPLFHEQYVDQVQAAGKAIFCEKPLGVDNDATRAMVKRIEAGSAPAAVNYVFGAAPSAVEMVSQVTSGACGDVQGADIRLHFCRWPRDWQAQATWLRDRDQGGWVREVVSHYVFLVHRLFGPATIEQVHVGYPDDGTSEQSLAAVLDCAGTTVRIVGTSDAAGADEVEFTVRGSDRSFRLTNWYQLSSAAGDGPWEAVLPDDAIAPPAAYAAQLGQVAAMATGGDHVLATFAEAFAVQELVEALLEPSNSSQGVH